MRPPKQKQPRVKKGLCQVLEHVDVDVDFRWLLCCHCDLSVTLISVSCEPIVVSYGTITLPLHETVGYIQSFQMVQFVQTGSSLLKSFKLFFLFE